MFIDLTVSITLLNVDSAVISAILTVNVLTPFAKIFYGVQ
jgi:hypothetical protein